MAVGAIAPSSKALAKAMIRDVRLKPGDIVLELGPGTGAFTGYIRQIIPQVTDYIGVERDGSFVKLLRERYPDMLFVNDSAENLERLFRQKGLKSPRLVVSGLPFANKKKSIRDQIINSLKAIIDKDTIFRTYLYVHSYFFTSSRRFREEMRVLFDHPPRGELILKNLPPAYVLTWSKQL